MRLIQQIPTSVKDKVIQTHKYTHHGFIQDFRFWGETQHLGGSGGMFPQENAK